MNPPLLAVSGLKTWFACGNRWIGAREWVRAVDGVDLTVERGEVLAVVGESGCGKTTLGRSLLRLIEPTAGRIRFDGRDLLAMPRNELRGMRRRMQIVFQDPYASLSPRRQIGQILAEPLLLHRIVAENKVADRAAALLAEVGLEPHFLHRYPHEMSGGQRQRVAIARALALEPELLVADEPVSALDVSVQAQILALLLDLQKRHGLAMVFISHDLTVVERIAQRTAVMYRGRVVEIGETARLMAEPRHPYTQALLSSVPLPDPAAARPRIRLSGELPPVTQQVRGCAFASRCPEAQDVCRVEDVPWKPGEGSDRVACHFR